MARAWHGMEGEGGAGCGGDGVGGVKAKSGVLHDKLRRFCRRQFVWLAWVARRRIVLCACAAALEEVELRTRHIMRIRQQERRSPSVASREGGGALF